MTELIQIKIPKRKFIVDEYRQLWEKGILKDDDRAEQYLDIRTYEKGEKIDSLFLPHPIKVSSVLK